MTDPISLLLLVEGRAHLSDLLTAQLKCTGEKSGCDRCLSNGWQCVYVGGRQSRQESLATTGKRKSSSVTTNLERQTSTESKRSSPNARVQSQSVTPPTYLDELAITSGNEIVTFDDISWQTETIQIRPSSRANPEPSPMDVTSDWRMVNGGRDLSSSLSDLSHTSRTQQNSTGGPESMNLDFDVDEFLSMPGIFSPDTQSLDASPVNVDLQPGHQTISTAQQSEHPSALFSQSFSHTDALQCRPNRTAEQSSSGPCALTDHQCTIIALRVLEISMAGPKQHALPDELLRFLANASSGTRSLAKLSKCSMCIQYSPFLVLMVVNVNASLDAVDNALKLLKNRSIRAEASRWTQYGVDTVEEFVRMYSPLLMPIVATLKTIINDIRQVCLAQTLQSQLDSLEQAGKRLGGLETDLQSLL
nr:hypothetical protein [Phoma sp.]